MVVFDCILNEDQIAKRKTSPKWKGLFWPWAIAIFTLGITVFCFYIFFAHVLGMNMPTYFYVIQYFVLASGVTMTILVFIAAVKRYKEEPYAVYEAMYDEMFGKELTWDPENCEFTYKDKIRSLRFTSFDIIYWANVHYAAVWSAEVFLLKSGEQIVLENDWNPQINVYLVGKSTSMYLPERFEIDLQKTTFNPYKESIADKKIIPSKSARIGSAFGKALCIIGMVLVLCKYPIGLWMLAGTSFSPKIVDQEVYHEWDDVQKYAHSDGVAYYFNWNPLPGDSACLAIDLSIRGFKFPKQNHYEVACYMVFSGKPDSIVEDNRLLVFFENGDFAEGKAYRIVHSKPLIRTSRTPRQLQASRTCSYNFSRKDLKKLLTNSPVTIKVESANGWIVKPARKRANTQLQQRYYMVEEYLNEFHPQMKRK